MSTKVVSYTALHYGKDYFASAIRSVIDHVDEHWILYAAQGSHGHRTDVRCPDTRDELYAIAQAAAGDKLRWVDGDWRHEGEQRDSIHELVPDADEILVVDADEIWDKRWLLGMKERPSRTVTPTARYVRLPMVHFWRSFWRAIVDDPAYPIRIIYPNAPNVEINQGGFSDVCGYISHFGYAQRPEIVHYKQLTHGHKGEWRKDIDWYQDRFLANAQFDCHPTNLNYWNPVDVDPLNYLPSWMAAHPYFDKAVIE